MGTPINVRMMPALSNVRPRTSKITQVSNQITVYIYPLSNFESFVLGTIKVVTEMHPPIFNFFKIFLVYASCDYNSRVITILNSFIIFTLFSMNIKSSTYREIRRLLPIFHSHTMHVHRGYRVKLFFKNIYQYVCSSVLTHITP